MYVYHGPGEHTIQYVAWGPDHTVCGLGTIPYSVVWGPYHTVCGMGTIPYSVWHGDHTIQCVAWGPYHTVWSGDHTTYECVTVCPFVDRCHQGPAQSFSRLSPRDQFSPRPGGVLVSAHP